MNATSDFNLDLRYSVYAAIKSIKDEDYDAWIQMDKSTLLDKTMKKLRGQCNPAMLREIIHEL